MQSPPDITVTSELLYKSAAVIAVVDAAILVCLQRYVPSARFRNIKWILTATTAVFWSVLWTSILVTAWDFFYGYVFPIYARWAAPLYGFIYASIGLGMWWLALRLPGNPVLSFCLIGGLEGFFSHLWAVFGLGVIEKIPLMRGVSAASVIVFAVFEKVLYWSFILCVALTIHALWVRRARRVASRRGSTSPRSSVAPRQSPEAGNANQ